MGKRRDGHSALHYDKEAQVLETFDPNPRRFDADSENIADLVATIPMPSAEQMRVGELALDAFYDGAKDADVQSACANVYRAMRALELRSSLNQEAREHLPYDNPRDPFASPNRMPPDFLGSR